MLSYFDPDARPPARVSLFGKPGCPHCACVRKLLRDNTGTRPAWINNPGV